MAQKAFNFSNLPRNLNFIHKYVNQSNLYALNLVVPMRKTDKSQMRLSLIVNTLQDFNDLCIYDGSMELFGHYIF